MTFLDLLQNFSLENLVGFLQPYGHTSYYVILGMLLACGLGLPLPEDIILVSGGILSALGITDYWIVCLLCLVGVVGGDSGVFLIGRMFGPGLKRTMFFRKLISEKADARVSQAYVKHGNKVIFMARFMPGLRMPMFLTAGIYQVSFLRFFAFNGFAALISVPLWVYVGFFFGKNLRELVDLVQKFELAIFTVVGVVVAIVFVQIMRARRKMAAEPFREEG